MKKLFVAIAICALSGCVKGHLWGESDNTYESYETVQQTTKTTVVETKTVKRPSFVIDTPYGMADLYDETTAPQMYQVIASRATNKMLEQTTDVYEKASPNLPKIYVMQVKKTGPDPIPNGFFYARQVTKEIIQGSKTYQVVNTMEEADYMLEVLVTKVNIPNLPGNVLQYKIILLDKGNNQIGTWVENIRQVQNDDRSWW